MAQIVTTLPKPTYQKWVGLPNRKKARQTVMLCIRQYIRGILDPNDLPYFKTTPKYVLSEKLHLTMDAKLKKQLIDKLAADHIKTAQFLRAIIEMIVDYEKEA